MGASTEDTPISRVIVWSQASTPGFNTPWHDRRLARRVTQAWHPLAIDWGAMMIGLREVFLTVICVGLASFLVHVIVSGLRSGRIAHTDTHAYIERKRNPVGYWFMILLFTAFILLALYAWAASVLPVLKSTT